MCFNLSTYLETLQTGTEPKLLDYVQGTDNVFQQPAELRKPPRASDTQCARSVKENEITMTRNTARIIGSSMLAMAVLALCALPVVGQDHPSPQMTVAQPVRFAISPPLRELANIPQEPVYGFREANPVHRLNLHAGIEQQIGVDPVEQSSPAFSSAAITPGLSVLGINSLCGCYPPDTEGSVGDNQFNQVVEWVNLDYAVYNKITGALEMGPLRGNSIFSSLGGICAANNNGDPIAQFDKVNGRWLLAQNVFAGSYGVCVAVSQTADATGSYYLYEFPVVNSGFPDYPKWGIWSTPTTSGYFQTWNNFGPGGGGFVGAVACGYNDVKLRAGDHTAEQICFQGHGAPNYDYSLLPADRDSPAPPPAGQDEFFIGSYDVDTSNMHLFLYSMHPVFSNPSQSTFTGTGDANPITVPTYTPFCDSSRSCVPEPGGYHVDALGDRVMYRFAYYQDNELPSVPKTPPLPALAQHWFVNHVATASGGQAGVRWYEFTAPQHTVVGVGGVSLFQSGTFAPNSDYRWMASMARDKVGNLAVGYSISNGSTLYPSINVAGRAPRDPVGQLSGETRLTTGTGSQTGSGDRWGDYSNMSLDPADNCTMWYFQEYLLTTGTAPWQTQLNQIKFNGCD